MIFKWKLFKKFIICPTWFQTVWKFFLMEQKPNHKNCFNSLGRIHTTHNLLQDPRNHKVWLLWHGTTLEIMTSVILITKSKRSTNFISFPWMYVHLRHQNILPSPDLKTSGLGLIPIVLNFFPSTCGSFWTFSWCPEKTWNKIRKRFSDNWEMSLKFSPAYWRKQPFLRL